MCGIAAIAGGRFADPLPMRRMLDRLAHRGPDDGAVAVMAGAALGHRRLSIIDLDGGRQPIASEDGTIRIVCNGEIYNYEELRRGLLERGHRFRTGSDTEVVLHLYEEVGPACVERLRGMFAFVIYDETRRRLFAARDHMGQKPLFYRFEKGELALASEIKALLPLSDTVRPDLGAMAQYLSLRIVAPPLTMFAGVRKLPPAHRLVFDLDGGAAPRIERYWRLSFADKLKGSERGLTDAVEARMIEAVRLCMVSDVPVGAFLSGGLDSTLVVALAQTHARQVRGAEGPMPTFTIGIPYEGYDEAPAARLVAERYGTDHHEVEAVPSLVAHLPELVWHLDEPSDPLSVCAWLVSALAAKHVKVVLGGDGGDEMFGGYDRYYGNLYAGHLARLPSPLRRTVLGSLLKLVPDGGWYKSRGHQMKWLYEASFMEGGERYARSLGYFYVREGQRAQLFGPELLDVLAKGFDPYAPIAEAYADADAEHPVDRMLAADAGIRLPDHSVMIQDRAAMAHGLEARAPFMDHELAGFCARLPVAMKVRTRELRWVQKRLAEKYLPKAVLARKKQGFASALPYLLKDEYRLLFDVFLRDSRLAALGILDQQGIDAMLATHQAGRADHGNRLWLLLNAEAWYRMHVEGLSRAAMHGRIADAGAPGGRKAA
ncbi:MAG: asparagine synthase (glutamine-hydrolyzing) [Geminicoccaceae bacterium]|nr:asparagine synthase (glutamine-hydrolyzing) [Geminicoccaceae bacterium]